MTEAVTRPPEMPERLRTTIGDDLRPVRPLAPPWLRLMYIVPVILVAVAMPFAYFALRDTGGLGVLLGWIPIAVQILLALFLLVFALREGVPGWRASRGALFGLVIGAYVLQVAVNLLIFGRVPVDSGGAGAISMWMACFRVESLIGLPVLVAIAWLVARAMPHRPLVAGFLAGSGAGFVAEASWRMFCPYSDPGHVMLGHTGGILVLGVTGFLLGYLWSAYTERCSAA